METTHPEQAISECHHSLKGVGLRHAGALYIFYYPDRVVVRADIDHAFEKHPETCLVNTISALHDLANKLGSKGKVLAVGKAYDDDLYVYFAETSEVRKGELYDMGFKIADTITLEDLREMEWRCSYLDVVPDEIVSKAIHQQYFAVQYL